MIYGERDCQGIVVGWREGRVREYGNGFELRQKNRWRMVNFSISSMWVRDRNNGVTVIRILRDRIRVGKSV